LKIYHNFESYQNMLTILSYFFNIIEYKFVLYVMYITTHLHVVKDSWNLKNTVSFLKI